MQQAVEAAECFLDHLRQFGVLRGVCAVQIERDNHRLGMPGRFDLVIHGRQVGLGLAQQQHDSAVGSIGFRGGGADATTGTGDEYDAPGQQVGAG